VAREQGALSIPAGLVELDADLVLPRGAGAVVLFVHGSGSSRASSRNRFVARELQLRPCSSLVSATTRCST
jgi:hypothetical protein